MRIKIGTHFIGHDESIFIIAEAGANHKKFNMARWLIDAASDAKVDAVKF